MLTRDECIFPRRATSRPPTTNMIKAHSPNQYNMNMKPNFFGVKSSWKLDHLNWVATWHFQLCVATRYTPNRVFIMVDVAFHFVKIRCSK